jgi:hypothetical protein
MPVAVAVADGSQTLLVVLVVLVVAAPAVAVVHPEQVALLEPMLLVAAAEVALQELQQPVLVDQELSLFATQYQAFQHQTSMPPPTQEPQQTTSLKQPHSPLRAQHLLDPPFSCLLTESQLVAPA